MGMKIEELKVGGKYKYNHRDEVKEVLCIGKERVFHTTDTSGENETSTNIEIFLKCHIPYLEPKKPEKLGRLGVAKYSQPNEYGYDIVKGQVQLLEDKYDKEYWQLVTVDDDGNVWSVEDELE